MQIDWVTVAAQLVNFLVLVWLLHRFLYRPIAKAMVRREERIKEELTAAEREQASARAEAARLAAERHDLEQRREELLAQTQNEAHQLRLELERVAREEVDSKRAAWQAELSEDKAAFLSSMRHHAESAMRILAEEAMDELAHADLDERIASVFIDRLETIGESDRTRLLSAIEKAEGSATLESGAELSADIRRRLTRAVHELVGREVAVAYVADRDLLFGIRLRAGGQTIEWTLDSYLDRFAESLRNVFPEADQAGMPVEAGNG